MEIQFIDNLISKINWWKVAFFTLLTLIIFLSGVYIGKKSIKLPTDNPPIYVPGDTMTIDVPKPYPVIVNSPIDTANIIATCVKDGIYWELFPEKVRDSLVYIPTSQDTLDIITDWATGRMYKEKIFDVDTLGSVTISAKVQYNRLFDVTANVVPVVKTVPYLMPPKKISPFVGIGINTSNCVMATGGAFFSEKWGGMLLYERNIKINDNIIGGAVLYKF